MLSSGDLRVFRGYPDTGAWNVMRYNLVLGTWGTQVSGLRTEREAIREARRLARATWGRYNPA